MTKKEIETQPSKLLDVPVPKWVRDVLGEVNVAVIEAGLFSKKEYKILLDFIANRGFDLDAVLHDCSLHRNPPLAENIHNREFPESLSSLFFHGSHQSRDGQASSKIPMPNLTFGLGRARLLFNDEHILIEHGMHKPAGDGKADAYECIRLFGKRPEILRSLASEVLHWHVKRKQPGSKDGKFALWMMELDSEEAELRLGYRGLRTARPLTSLIIPHGIREELESDAREFFCVDAMEWYRKHGIAHRRTWLLHGARGCGKTTAIGSLAAALKLNLCYIDIDRLADANPLEPAFRNIPCPAIVAIEDIERIVPNGHSGESGTYSNVLQGIAAVEGILVIMTTSNLESIDELQLKSSRIDRQFEFKAATQEDVEQLFLTYYPDAGQKVAKRFAIRVFDRPEKDARIIATLQEHFIFSKKLSAEECIDALPEYFKKYYPEGSKEDRLGFYL